MRKIVLLLLFLFPFLVLGQSKNQNYLKTRIYNKPSKQAIDTIVNITYHDGLGRPMQTVAYNSGGAGQDIVVPMVYDPYTSRQTKQYLPYAVPETVGNTLNYRDNNSVITDQGLFYTRLYPADVNGLFDTKAYSEVEIERSPLGRVIQQAAPGDRWALTAGHTIRTEYDANVSKDKVYDFRIKFTDNNAEKPELYVLPSRKYYESGMLLKKTIKDENWTLADGNNKTTIEFTDMLGRVVLKRQYNESRPHDTYYVFDDYGNLTYVIPPLASDKIIKTNLLYVAGPFNYSWTKLVEVDSNLADIYDRKMEDYENEDILNVDLLSQYEGTGGFALSTDNDGNITLDINITTASPMPYRNGVIADLSDLGEFSDRELGKINGDGYEYYFLVRDNKLKISGSGDVPSLIQSFTGNTMLEYKSKYSWAEMVDGDSAVLSQYLDEVSKLSEDELLTANIENDYGGIGGASITFAEDDTFSLSLNIQTPLAPVEFKDGAIFTLDAKRPIPDSYLGEVTGDGYSYKFQVLKNMLIINGSGKFSHINFNATKWQSLVNNDAEKLCYIYNYDRRNRVIKKHIPDNGWTYIVYDNLDRQVMIQDENLRSKQSPDHNWMFTSYDVFGRVAITGSYYSADTVDDIRQSIDISNPVIVTKSYAPIVNEGMRVYYNNAVGFSNGRVLAVNYYDDYHFDTGWSQVITDPFPNKNTWDQLHTPYTKGLQTGSLVRILEMPNKFTSSVTRFDEKARPIWTWSYNNYLNAWNGIDFKLDFTGKVLETKTQHQTMNSPKVTLWDFFTHDQAGRPLQHSQSIGNDENGLREVIFWNSYDALGNVIEKKLGGKLNAGATYLSHNALQKVNYSKNIRGWLTAINDIATNQTSSNDLFAYGINYDGLYNGNISGTSWTTKLSDAVKNYTYSYDALNRLTDALYTNTSNSTEKYHEKAINYDKNGNIVSLARWGATVPGEFDKIDELEYDYKPMSNQLMSINDKILQQGIGYSDNNKSTNDFDYHIGGNMKLDKNKFISLISYNHLNLPTSIAKDSGSNIMYIYDATGEKIEKKVTEGSSIITTNYSYGFVYENNQLQYFPHEEGYVKKENGIFSYVYQYKDHLGNVRLSYSDLDKDGAINDASVFYDGFEEGNGWSAGYGESLVIDNTIKRTGNYSAKLKCTNNIASYWESDYHLNIDNAVDTEYTFTAWVKGSGNGQITLLMTPVVDANYWDSAWSTESGTEWRPIKKTILVRAGTRQLTIRVDILGNGEIWFDDVSLKKTNGVSEIVDNTDYYPFGMEHGNTTVMSGGNSVAQKIKYSGKEFQDELDLDIYDFGARNYDPTIGRWFNVDPLAEYDYATAYAYCGNNPVFFIDPDGRKWKDPAEANAMMEVAKQKAWQAEYANFVAQNEYEVAKEMGNINGMMQSIIVMAESSAIAFEMRTMIQNITALGANQDLTFQFQAINTPTDRYGTNDTTRYHLKRDGDVITIQYEGGKMGIKFHETKHAFQYLSFQGIYFNDGRAAHRPSFGARNEIEAYRVQFAYDRGEGSWPTSQEVNSISDINYGWLKTIEGTVNGKKVNPYKAMAEYAETLDNKKRGN